MAVLFKLDFRPLFRRFARAELDALANAIASLPRPKVGGRAGGSLVDTIRKMKARIKRWGYVLPLSDPAKDKGGQKLWWLIHGAVRNRSGTGTTGKTRDTGSIQEPRPVPNRDEEFAISLGTELEAEAARKFAREDARVRA